MATIRKLKIFLEPVLVELDPHSEEMQRGPVDAFPKRIADLDEGDFIQLCGQAQIAKIEELPGAPTVDEWEPRTLTGYGILAGSGGSVDEFLREKHAEIAREDTAA